MSIKSRLVQYNVRRSTNALDDYGTPTIGTTTVFTIMAFLAKNKPTHDAAKPYYTETQYVGATTSTNLLEGDVLEREGKSYMVKDIGETGTNYTAIYLDEY